MECHRLHGFVKVDGQTCAIEYLGEGPGEPNYEVMAPTGHHFDEGVHSLLCTTLDDLQTRIAQPLVKCGQECEGQ
jgi:hypothetical protein